MARAAFDSQSVPHTFGRGHRYIREPAVKLASRRADALVVQTESQAAYALEHFGARPERVHVIPNSVDTSFFLVEPIKSPRPVVVWVGSWLAGKGSEWVPRVFADLRLRRPDAVLHLVGTGAGEAAVRASFADEDQEGLVVTPKASRDGVRSALAAARVGLFTSAFEGFGRVPLEMAAAGLPVVSTKAGVAGELIQSGVNGEVVDFREVGATVNALERYLSHAALAAEHGRNARSAARRFEQQHIGAQWNGLLQVLVHRAK
nr:glycosyltransferase family 4 protein [Frigoribacterium sp. Leaf164]